MAKGGNKFARMLQGNGQKMTVILVYTILEWILISLLLLNALFSYLITRFALYFGLKPPCLLCSRVDDLFHPPTGLSLFPDLICEHHVLEISSLAFDSEGEKVDDDLIVDVQPRSLDGLVAVDSSLQEVPIGEKPRDRRKEEKNEDSGEEDVVLAREREADDLAVPDSTSACGSNVDERGDLNRVQGSEEDVKTDGEISIGSEICDREHVLQPSRLEPIQSASEEEIKAQTEGSREPSLERASSAASDHSVSNFRSILRARSADLQDDLLEGEDRTDGPRFENSSHASKTDRSGYGSESIDGSVMSDIESPESLTMDQLKDELQTARKSLRNLYAELEQERSASAVATNQTMAMIAKLQEERSKMRMEASNYQRIIDEQIPMEGPQHLTDEQSEYLNEELQMLNDLVITLENEKEELENELEIYREKLLRYETEGRMTESNTNGMVGIIDEDVELGKDEQLLDQEEDQYEAVGSVLNSKADNSPETQSCNTEKLLDNLENDMLTTLAQLKLFKKRISSVKRVKSEDQNPRDKDPDEAGESHDETSDASIAADGDSIEMKKVANGSTNLPHSDATAENGEGQFEGQETAGSDDSDFLLDSDEGSLNLDENSIEEHIEEFYTKMDNFEYEIRFIKVTVRLLKNGERCMDLLEKLLELPDNVTAAEATVGNESNILTEATA